MIEKRFEFLDREYRLAKQNEEYVLYEDMDGTDMEVYVPIDPEDIVNIKQQNDAQVIDLLREWDASVGIQVELGKGGDIKWKK